MGIELRIATADHRCRHCGVKFCRTQVTKWYCSKVCAKEHERLRKLKLAKLRYANNKQICKLISRRSKLKNKCGITEAQYNAWLEKQKGLCAICKGVNADGRTLDVDHDHQTGYIRGLLCRKCNMGIGNLSDSYTTLCAAIHYMTLSIGNQLFKRLDEKERVA